MDTKSGVEFVALTKEEIEDIIAKAALAGASVAAETNYFDHRIIKWLCNLFDF